MSNVVSIHPYFKARPGELDNVKAALREFVDKTAAEEKCLHYEFTLNGDEIFCREAYVGGEGVNAHLENVGEKLQAALQIADITRLEILGPAGELDKLREPLKNLSPVYFELLDGFRR